MSVNESLSLLSCATNLALALLAITRASQNPLTLPLALAYVCAFAWNFASFAFDRSGRLGWFFLERASSPFSAPLAFHLMAAFAGRFRRMRRVAAAAYVAAAALSLPALFAFVLPPAQAFTVSRWWAALHLSLIVAPLALAAVLLLKQVRASFDSSERKSTRWVLASLVTGSVLVPTELLADLGLPVPRLGHLGTLLASTLMGVVMWRSPLFQREPSPRASFRALGLGVLAVSAYTGVFSLLGRNMAMVVWGTATVTLVLIIALRATARSAAQSRQRMEYLATLGRFSAQMAHDLKNPLAALKGAVQFLQVESQGGRRAANQEEFLTLLEEQIERITSIIDQYQRLGRVHPIPRAIDVNGMLRNVLDMLAFTKRDGITLYTEFAEELPHCHADGDLLAGALENLLANAVDAMPRGGSLRVKTARADATDGVLIAVEDDGVGMDARVRERAFDDFYTTKAQGSGLGLAFVKRVAEAHGGSVQLSSVLGRGTTVRLCLPLQAEPQHGE